MANQPSGGYRWANPGGPAPQGGYPQGAPNDPVAGPPPNNPDADFAAFMESYRNQQGAGGGQPPAPAPQGVPQAAPGAPQPGQNVPGGPTGQQAPGYWDPQTGAWVWGNPGVAAPQPPHGVPQAAPPVAPPVQPVQPAPVQPAAPNPGANVPGYWDPVTGSWVWNTNAGPAPVPAPAQPQPVAPAGQPPYRGDSVGYWDANGNFVPGQPNQGAAVYDAATGQWLPAPGVAPGQGQPPPQIGDPGDVTPADAAAAGGAQGLPPAVAGLPLPFDPVQQQPANALPPGTEETVNWTLGLIIGVPAIIATSILVALGVVLTRRNKKKKILRSYDRITRVSMDPGRFSEEEDETEDEEMGTQLQQITVSSSSRKKDKSKDKKGKGKATANGHTSRKKRHDTSEED